jgi:hypothetical protein
VQIFIAGTCAVSRYKLTTEPEICHGAGFKMRAGARFAQRSEAKLGVRVVIYKSHVIESRKFKNRDKQMTYIVRVSG